MLISDFAALMLDYIDGGVKSESASRECGWLRLNITLRTLRLAQYELDPSAADILADALRCCNHTLAALHIVGTGDVAMAAITVIHTAAARKRITAAVSRAARCCGSRTVGHGCCTAGTLFSHSGGVSRHGCSLSLHLSAVRAQLASPLRNRLD